MNPKIDELKEELRALDSFDEREGDYKKIELDIIAISPKAVQFENGRWQAKSLMKIDFNGDLWIEEWVSL